MGSGGIGWSVGVEGSRSGAADSIGWSVLTEDLCVLPRVARDVGLRVTSWSVRVEGWSSGAVGTIGSGILTGDLCVLPRDMGLGVTGVLTEDLCVLPRLARDVFWGVTGWSLVVEDCSSGAVRTTGAGDLCVLLRVAQDVGSGLMGWSVGVVGWGSKAIEETGEGVILEDPRGLTLGFAWRGSSSEDKGVSGAS